MKVKCLINCNGYGYEDFKKDTEREIKNDIAKVLVKFGYVEEIPEEVVVEEEIPKEIAEEIEEVEAPKPKKKASPKAKAPAEEIDGD